MAHLYKTFNGENWQLATLMSALSFPGIAYCVFLISNIVVWYNSSTYAIPFLTQVMLIASWMVFSVPLVFLGAYVGNKQVTIQYPVETGNTARKIPEQSCFLDSIYDVPRWNCAVLLLLCRAVLHLGLGVDGILLLCLWFPVADCWCHCCNMCRVLSLVHILQTLQRGLPLVVAFLLQRGFGGRLRLFVFDSGVAQGKQPGNIHSLLWLHGFHLSWTLHHDGICWGHDITLVQQDHLWIG